MNDTCNALQTHSEGLHERSLCLINDVAMRMSMKDLAVSLFTANHVYCLCNHYTGLVSPNFMYKLLSAVSTSLSSSL